MHARAWNTGDGPKTIFADGVRWLRENAVLLPGVTTLARLVSRVRDEVARVKETVLADLQLGEDPGVLLAEQVPRPGRRAPRRRRPGFRREHRGHGR